MGVGYNPKIVTDGLVLCLDAANPKSYNYNIATYSQDFTNAVYSKSTGLISATGLLAPDGTLTATTMTDDDAANWESFVRNFTVPNDSSTYNVSLYIRKTTGGTSPTTGFNISFAGGTQKNYFPRFNTDTGSLGGGDTNVVTSENNNYWRISFTISNNGTGNTTLNISYYPATGPYGGSDLNTTTGSQTVWGFQITRGATLLPYNINVNDSTTTWNDISITKTTGTLTSGAIYSSNDRGIIVLDGVDDHVAVSNPQLFNAGYGSFSIDCWLKQKTINRFNGIVEARATGLHGFLWILNYPSQGYASFFLNTTLESGQNIYNSTTTNFATTNWMHTAVTINRASEKITFYKNGVQEGNEVSITSVGTIDPGSGYSYLIGGDIGGAEADIDVSCIKHYNKALTSSEIEQNFDALRGRFGI